MRGDCECVVYVADVSNQRGVGGHYLVLCNAYYHLPNVAVNLCKRD